jgi:endonuclease YncB( thermonuclease family)
MKKIVCLSVLLFCALSVFGYPAKVVGIADGDTCTVLTAENSQIKIRLAGIDTPEKTQAFGTKAKQALSDKVFGQTVEVKEQTKDQYGRTVADLYLGERWINLEMVAEGWAWHYKAYSKDQKLADKEPVPPWDFRRNDKTEAQARAPAPTQEQAPTQTKVQEQTQTQAIESGYWLNTGSNVRHNSGCRYFNNTKKGRPCTKEEGKACGICGG